MENPLLATIPTRLIAPIDEAIAKQARAEAEVESAFVASAIALTKSFDLLRGSPGDGAQFLHIIRMLREEVDGAGVLLGPDDRLRLLTKATDDLLAVGTAQIMGKELEPALRDEISAGILAASISENAFINPEGAAVSFGWIAPSGADSAKQVQNSTSADVSTPHDNDGLIAPGSLNAQARASDDALSGRPVSPPAPQRTSRKLRGRGRSQGAT